MFKQMNGNRQALKQEKNCGNKSNFSMFVAAEMYKKNISLKSFLKKIYSYKRRYIRLNLRRGKLQRLWTKQKRWKNVFSLRVFPCRRAESVCKAIKYLRRVEKLSREETVKNMDDSVSSSLTGDETRVENMKLRKVLLSKESLANSVFVQTNTYN